MADKNPFSINPCLFIGIGTNGWRILHELRQLIYEEFGVGGLPCFRYIGIESDSGKRPDDSFLPHAPRDYERITPVYISIPDVSIIRRRLDPKLPEDYLPGLVEWLDPSLIERGNRSYQAGAGNARQAGRMCLWANWAQFKQAVAQCLDQVKDADNRVATETFLRRDYFGKKRRGSQPPGDSLINSAPKVYIFGTLCGGTCSGSFIDIAYYVSRELGLLADVRRTVRRGVADPEVIGLLTVTDLRRINDAETRKSVVNCWAALRELDFHYQKEGRFLATFPDGATIDTSNEPFDTLYIESLQNLGGTGFDRNDYNGLAQMCAMNLFTEVVAGLAARKDESRVNLRMTATGFLERNQSDHMRAFSSFGLSAFWYPKYRIAQAINRYLAMEMCDAWLGRDVQLNPVQDAAARDLESLLAEARGSLVGTAPKSQCNENLPNAIDREFDQRKSEFLAADESGLDGVLVNFPSEQSTFANRLSGPGGDYFIRISNAEPLVARDIKARVVNAVEQYFRDHSCAETTAYVAALLQGVTKEIGSLPTEVGGLTQQMDLGLTNDVHHGWWAKSVGLHSECVDEYRSAVWDDLKQRVVTHLANLRGFFLRRVLGSLQADLSNVQNLVAQAQSRLRIFRDKCERERQELVGFKPPGHIIIIAAGELNTIAEDVDLGARQVLRDVDRNTLRKLFVTDAEPMQLLSNASQENLDSRMDAGFGPHSQNITAGFQIGAKVLATSRTRIPDLVDRAAPYVEAVAAFRPLATKDTPNFLFCSDANVAGLLVASINEKLKDDRYSPADSPLDHFVIFYHEAIGLALSDLAIGRRADELLVEMEKDRNRIATNYTHKQGERMFDFKLVQEYYSTARWIRCMKYLNPELFQAIGNDLCLDYKTADGLPGLLQIDNPQMLREYFELYGTDSLIKRFRAQLVSLGREAVVDRMSSKWRETTSFAEKEALNRTHEEILKVVFK